LIDTHRLAFEDDRRERFASPIKTGTPERVLSMLTTESPLIHRIERLIDETPIVDPHTHLRCDQPSAPDLAALMSYHWLQTELRAVGMSPADLDTGLPPEERVRRSIPFLRRMRNTAMGWCFFRILNDLYDFRDRDIGEANYRALCDRVSSQAQDPNWPFHILRDRGNVQTVVTSLGNAPAGPGTSRLGIPTRFMLDAHYLFCPGVATDLLPFFANRTTKEMYYEALVELFGGERVSRSAVLVGRLNQWLDATVTGDVRFTNTYIPIDQRFELPDLCAADRALDRAAVGTILNSDQINAIVSLVTWTVLAWHHENRKAFQIAVGAEYFICDGKSIPRFDPTWASRMARTFHAFPGARFDLMMASHVMTQDVCVLARQFPNVYTSGYWWHSFFPALIEQIITLRLQVTPAMKIGGFLCDAYYVEWTYGKLQIVKKALASSLARLVEQRFYDEDQIPGLLRQILHDSPRDLYELAE
jgi:glucuronate isomerase